MEADGGSRGNPGPAGYGTLVRDADSGAVLAETAEAIGTATNNVAEYRGLIAGLRLVSRLDPDAEVEVRMDSKLVVEQMAGRWKVKHADLRPLALEAARVLPRPVATWTWVPRERNRRADQLANAALDGRVAEVVEHPLPETGDAPATTAPSRAPAPDGPSGRPPEGAPDRSSDPGRDRPSEPSPERERTPEPVRVPSAGSAARDRPAAAATVLLWLRHGHTADDTARRLTAGGGDGPGLDETGRHQAAVAAAALADAGIDAVLSSPARPARETAEVLAAALELDVAVEPAFADVDPGRWAGRSAEQVRAESPAWHAAWSVSPDVAPPDGESVRAVRARVDDGVRRVLERHRGRRVLVVTHAVPVGCAVTAALEAPLSSAMRLSVAPGSLTVVRHPAEGPPRTEAVALPPGTVLPG